MEWIVLLFIYLYGLSDKLLCATAFFTIASSIMLFLGNIAYLLSKSEARDTEKFVVDNAWWVKLSKKTLSFVVIPSLCIWILMPTSRTILYMAAGFGSVKMVEEIATNEMLQNANDQITITAGNTMSYFNTWLTTEIRKMETETNSNED